jgi:RNA polymerase sigma factor (TIGR02999 family)
MITSDFSNTVTPARAEPIDISQYWPEAYSDLEQMARARLKKSQALTELDTTGLVSETYARLARRHGLEFVSRPQFLAYCSQVMRSIVIDLLREKSGTRQSPDGALVTLNTGIINNLAVDENDPLRINEALDDLAKLEPRLAKVVEMRYFGGYSEAEVAEALNLTERTIQRDWLKARMLLRTMLTNT